MTVAPGLEAVRERLGPRPALRAMDHWIPGRRGLTYLVEGTSDAGGDSDGRRSVFKWCRTEELVCWRDLLPVAPVATPRIYRWWDATPELPAAVELEHIPELATPSPCYRFSPEYLALTDPSWRTTRLDDVFAQLGRMHAAHLGRVALEADTPQTTLVERANDLATWHASLRKLTAVAERPGADRWIAFWSARERRYEQVLAELEAFPSTWLWGDAKWDHLGRRADGTVVLLEWSTILGPAGSDLYLALFEAPARRQELLTHYRRSAGGWLADDPEAERYLRLGMARACYVHGPGQACLSVRGPAGAETTAQERAAWQADATRTAQSLEELERSYL